MLAFPRLLNASFCFQSNEQYILWIAAADASNTLQIYFNMVKIEQCQYNQDKKARHRNPTKGSTRLLRLNFRLLCEQHGLIAELSLNRCRLNF